MDEIQERINEIANGTRDLIFKEGLHHAIDKIAIVVFEQEEWIKTLELRMEEEANDG